MTFFIETVKTMLRFMGTTKDSECSKQSWERTKMEITTRLQSIL
jgi:hypothetical protein